jgi:hypothetical protein
MIPMALVSSQTGQRSVVALRLWSGCGQASLPQTLRSGACSVRLMGRAERGLDFEEWRAPTREALSMGALVSSASLCASRSG